MAWSHFEFESGANPYIAFEDWKRDEVLANCERLGYEVTEVHPFDGETRFYIVHDKEGRRQCKSTTTS